MNPPEVQPSRQPNLIHVIMVALLVWGGYLALGAIRAPGNHAMWRGLIVFGCTIAFLGLWAAALAVRRARSERDS
jgi:protein-S-isoprenylcysteine O-methyltransferase Ste14